jgi:uncharacterized protein
MFAKLRHAIARFIAPPAPVAAPKPTPKKKPRHIPRALLENFRANLAADETRPHREYKAPDLPKGVLPESGSTLAMDAKPVTGEPPRMALDSAAPNYFFLNGTEGFGTGLWFPGYPYLAELTQISEYRAPSETTSTEMTRKWFELQSKSGGDKSEVISEINAELERLKVRDHFRRCAKLDGEFGRGQIYLNIDDADDQKRQLPLEFTPEGIKKGSLKSIQSFEPYWSTPYSWNSAYPEREDFYKPVSWYIMGRKTHSDRILTFIGREVPDLLKPAYNFSGMSLTQLMEPYVNAWLRTRKAVNDLINNFSIPVLHTDLNVTLEDGAPEASGLLARLNVFTSTRNNQMVAAIQKDEELLEFAEASLGSLDKLQAQSQEHMAAPAHIPLIKLFGVVPTGLNATGEGEIQVWYDWIGASQVNLFQPQLEKLLKAVQLSLFGKIDDDLVIHWITLDEPTQKELSEIRKSDADADAVYITNGVIDPAEARTRLQTDPDSGYNNLTGGPPPEPPQIDPETGEEIPGGSETGDTDDENAEELNSFTMDEAKFEESKHKRGPGGQFGSGGHAAASKPDPHRAETQVTVHKEYKFAGQPDDPEDKPTSKLDSKKVQAAQTGSEKIAAMMLGGESEGAEPSGEKEKPAAKADPKSYEKVKPVAASENSPRSSQGGASKAPFVNQFMSEHKNREDDMARLGKLPDEKLKKAYELLKNVKDDDAQYMRELIRDVLKSSK